MIIFRDVLVRHGIVDSPRVNSLPVTAQLFFRNLLHVCDSAGRFSADSEELRLALYGKAPGVRRSHVDAWLQRIHQAGLVRLYTRGAKGYGEILDYGQRERYRRNIYPGPDAGELNFLEGPARELEQTSETDPPWLPTPSDLTGPPDTPIKKRREEKRREMAPAPESNDQWIKRLRELYPEVNIEEEIAIALKQKERQGRRLERRWFELNWLPNCSPAITREELAKKTTAPKRSEEGPAGWQEAIADTNYGPGGVFETTTWSELPPAIKSFVMQKLGTP